MNLEEFQFLEDQVFPYTEDTRLEFKMVNPTAPDRKKQQDRIKKKIWDYFKEYAVAFLNANVTGNLLIGILDEKNLPHLIKGIFLEPDFKDEIDRTANEQLKEIVRSVPLSCFKLDFYSLYNADKQKKDNWYVIRFSVTPVKEQDFLYRTKSGKCWIRRGSANVPLSEDDGSYNEEIKKRHLRVVATKLEELDKQLKNEPDDPELLLAKARALSDYGDPVESGKCYEKYIELFPGNQSVRKEYALKFQLDDKDQLRKALNILGIQENDNKLIAIVSSNINDYIWCTNTGFVLKKAKLYKDAIHFFNLALKINPKYRKAAYEKKKVYALLYTGRNIQ